MMIALRRRRELGLLRVVGATLRQVRAMARWEAALIITTGLGIGLAIAATALLPLSHALNGGLPYVPPGPFAAIRSSAPQRSLPYWPWRCRPGTRYTHGQSTRSACESRTPLASVAPPSQPA